MAVNDAIKVGGSAFGTSNPRNFKLINLHAMLNSFMFIFPSESVSANPLIEKKAEKIESDILVNQSK